MAGGILLQGAATSGNGNEWDMRGQSGTYTLSVVGAGTAITDGVVQWETALSSGYSGDWAPLGAPIAVVIGTQIQNFTGNLNYVRARIVTTVAGTDPSVTVRMQPPILLEGA